MAHQVPSPGFYNNFPLTQHLGGLPVCYSSAPVVTAYNMDTWGKIAVATTATITLTGMPSITTDSVGNVVLA